MALQNSLNRLLCLFEYTTVRYVGTQNKKIGFLYRIFQLAVMGYLLGWVFLKNKGYQVKDDTIESSVVTKVKGVARVNTTYTDFWGPEDYVFPNQGENFLSIMTSFIETPNQTLGIKTGICLKKTDNGTCEIYGWCPIETRSDPHSATVVRQAENFTLYIRNFIRFSLFNFSTSNVLKENRRLYLKNCLYNETDHPYCPIFRLGDIVNKTGHSFEDMARSGGSIGVLVEWRCDLDKYSDCRPKYSFVRLGNSSETGQRQRTLYKVYGIHLDIMVFGSASYVCDIMLLYMMKKRSTHTELKLERMTTYVTEACLLEMLLCCIL
ncbi:P2X purinoceptor 5 [Labeo rohita]|uniref:P2X purinoceptor 5 n=1 Tax=Labeo rohita TaxID=84645 RepID=A0ABQ8LZX2_LABRO|nr:P2X purinoceptor 5 [Labeo rohita]